MSVDRSAFRPEVEGLRAVAVSSVLLFHLDRQLLPGGFVGVDIFFVISGYLITAVILRDLANERFSLVRFYQRRIARLAPAFFTVAVVTTIGAWIIYAPQDFASTGATLAAAALGVANLKFMLQGNYFEVSQDAQPLLHYWSLAVEEQFYLIFPIALLLCIRVRAIWMITVVAIVSYILCVIVTQYRPAWAFYLLPTRAWELLIGATIAVMPAHVISRIALVTKGWLPAVGIALIFLSFFLLAEGPSFPGWVALLPVAGTACLIIRDVNRSDYVTRLLASGALMLLGRWSYSLYLWHWPVFCFVDYYFLMSSYWFRVSLKLLTAFCLASATHYLIERPARYNLSKEPNRVRAFTLASLAILIVVPLGIQIRKQNYINASFADVAAGGLVFETLPNRPWVILIGDSNASMYAQVLKEISVDRKINLVIASVADGDPLPKTNGKSDKLWEDTLEIVRKRQPELVLLSYKWAAKLRKDRQRLASAISLLEPYSRRIILINQPPSIPSAASRIAMRKGARPPFFEDVNAGHERRIINRYLFSVQSRTVRALDVARHFEGPRGEVISIDDKLRPLYHDSTHLSGLGARRVRALFDEVLLAIVREP